MKLYYLFLLVMFLLMGCGESPQRTREIQPTSIHKSDTIKKKRNTNLWGTSSYKKTSPSYKKKKSSYTPSKKTYKRKSSYKSRTRRHRR